MNAQPQTPIALGSLLAPLQKFLDRTDVIEICINRPNEVFVESYKGWESYEIEELSLDHLQSFISTVATHNKQQITATHPILSGSLPKGERIQIVIPPAVRQGTISITIRSPNERSINLDEYEEMGMFKTLVPNSKDALPIEDSELLKLYKKQDWKQFLIKAVRAKKNILVSGSTGSGKTTFSKALVQLIDKSERIITIEDTLELVIPQPNHVRLIYSKDGQGQAKITAKNLLESALRMRPDRVLLQELRDASAFYYLRSVNTGHSGSITTIHANSAMLAFEQLALLVKESDAGRDLTRGEIKAMLHQMVDVVVQLKRINGAFKFTEIFYDPSLKISIA